MVSARARMATAMAFRDQWRRPLVGSLLVALPVFLVVWSVAITLATPRRIGLPGGVEVETTMKDLHGPGMAAIAVAFVAALVGVFVMQSALRGDRRLVVAGFRPGEGFPALRCSPPPCCSRSPSPPVRLRSASRPPPGRQ